jgi:chromosomal replication initiator protein
VSSHPEPNNQTPGDDAAPETKLQEQQLELGEDDSAIALRKAWERTLRTLATQTNKPTYDNWLRPLKPLSWDGKVVVLGAPSSFARNWVEKKYAQSLRDGLAQHLGQANVQLRFVIATPDVQPLGEKPLPLQQAASTSSASSSTNAPVLSGNTPSRPATTTLDSRNPFALELAAAPLNESYTFDEFVVGKSNRLAHAGAMAVAQSPGTSYNPLFLYGSPGLGKSHLMHAIGHEVRARMPQARIAYVSGEMFTNHFVMALRDKRTEDFRRAYRSVDIWLVDDIQSIAMGQKEQTKEEFFNTFNTLHQMRRQIVIASDRSPSELRAMDERLRSRFMGGLVADIAPPELEMRMAILQKKAILGNMGISEDVIAFMANLIQSNIRALEGALIKLMAFASLTKTPVTRQLASDVLSSYYVDSSPTRTLLSAHPEDHAPAFPAPAPMDTGVDAIADAVGAQMVVTREQILAGGARSGRGANRLHGDAGYARQVAMYLAKELSGVPMTNLATAFGCKNHTAIAQAHKRLREELSTDSELAVLVARIRKILCDD